MSIHISGLEAQQAITLGHAQRLEERLEQEASMRMELMVELRTVSTSRDNWKGLFLVTALVILAVLIIATIELCKMRF